MLENVCFHHCEHTEKKPRFQGEPLCLHTNFLNTAAFNITPTSIDALHSLTHSCVVRVIVCAHAFSSVSFPTHWSMLFPPSLFPPIEAGNLLFLWLSCLAAFKLHMQICFTSCCVCICVICANIHIYIYIICVCVLLFAPREWLLSWHCNLDQGYVWSCHIKLFNVPRVPSSW